VVGSSPELAPDEIARYFLGLLEQTDPPVETLLPVS